jgi:hypothetical protein
LSFCPTLARPHSFFRARNSDEAKPILLASSEPEHPEGESKPPEITLWVNRTINAAKRGANSIPGEGEYRFSNPGMVKSSKVSVEGTAD